MEIVSIGTRDGIFIASFSENGLAALEFPRPQTDRSHHGDKIGPPQLVRRPGISPNLGRWIKLTEAALLQRLDGRVPEALPPLDFSAGTAFQQTVWQALTAIATGETKTCREVAEAIGKPRATRAVGSACGANPMPVIVPCHRVLATGGGLGGFAGGLDWKHRLLTREGVLIT